MNMSLLRTVLVNDEVLARLALRRALATHAEVEIVGECGSAAEAIQAMHVLRPDLVFLDIQMPGLNGFELLPNWHPTDYRWWCSLPPSPSMPCVRSMRARWTMYSSL